MSKQVIFVNPVKDRKGTWHNRDGKFTKRLKRGKGRRNPSTNPDVAELQAAALGIAYPTPAMARDASDPMAAREGLVPSIGPLRVRSGGGGGTATSAVRKSQPSIGVSGTPGRSRSQGDAQGFARPGRGGYVIDTRREEEDEFFIDPRMAGSMAVAPGSLAGPAQQAKKARKKSGKSGSKSTKKSGGRSSKPATTKGPSTMAAKKGRKSAKKGTAKKGSAKKGGAKKGQRKSGTRKPKKSRKPRARARRATRKMATRRPLARKARARKSAKRSTRKSTRKGGRKGSKKGASKGASMSGAKENPSAKKGSAKRGGKKGGGGKRKGARKSDSARITALSGRVSDLDTRVRKVEAPLNRIIGSVRGMALIGSGK